MGGFEIQKFVATNKPPETVKYNIVSFEDGLKELLSVARDNPTGAYRLIQVAVDFVTVTQGAVCLDTAPHRE